VNWNRYAGPFTPSEGVFTLEFRSQDQAGNFEPPQSRIFKVDTTPPVITGSRAPLGNASGWNNTDVRVSFACSDALAGVAAGNPSGNTVLSAEGSGQQATGTCQDVAGNSASALLSGLNIDKTPPVVSVTGITNGATYVLQAIPTAGCTTTDVLSGVVTTATATVTGGTANGVGTFTATCAGASDAAGNAAAPVTATFYVRYNFAGFFRPLTVGVGSYSGLFKLGRTIPVKWSLTDANGTYVSVPSTVKHLELAFNGDCVSDADGTPIDLGTTGGSGLRYDETERQFIYNWDTSNAGQGCYSVLLYLDDDSPPRNTIVKLKP
jgi:large repetitive protein